MLEKTSNGIAYNWWIDGPQGAKFELFRVRGRDSKAEVDIAKRELRRERDVVSIKVTYKES